VLDEDGGVVLHDGVLLLGGGGIGTPPVV
jgi:hypothetical protein